MPPDTSLLVRIGPCCPSLAQKEDCVSLAAAELYGPAGMYKDNEFSFLSGASVLSVKLWRAICVLCPEDLRVQVERVL
jgi:hypothetical protein